MFNLIFGHYDNLLALGILNISSAGLLDDIPFDILMPDPPSESSINHGAENYLIREYSIGLIPSGTFGMATWSPDATLSSSAFVAPEYADQSLRYHTKEIKSGSEMLSGKFISGHPRREELFKLAQSE